MVVVLAEGDPPSEEGVVSFACLPGSGLGGVLQSKAEINLELCLSGR